MTETTHTSGTKVQVSDVQPLVAELPPGEVVRADENSKLAIWIFLGGEIIFFTALIMAFVVVPLRADANYANFRAHLSIPLAGFNTLILITSSYMVVQALDALESRHITTLRNTLIGVIILGAIFMIGQAIEWSSLFGEGITGTDKFGSPFFVITGIHGLHVFIGVVWGFLVLTTAIRGPANRYHQGVEMFTLYWHFVDIVWIILFTLFYLI